VGTEANGMTLGTVSVFARQTVQPVGTTSSFDLVDTHHARSMVCQIRYNLLQRMPARLATRIAQLFKIEPYTGRVRMAFAAS
jgi:hypothetical protein